MGEDEAQPGSLFQPCVLSDNAGKGWSTLGTVAFWKAGRDSPPLVLGDGGLDTAPKALASLLDGARG